MDFYLLTDMLIYCEQQSLTGTYKLKQTIQLFTCRVNEKPTVLYESSRAFAIESPSKSFVAWAA
jgi:hypothetical protein